MNKDMRDARIILKSDGVTYIIIDCNNSKDTVLAVSSYGIIKIDLEIGLDTLNECKKVLIDYNGIMSLVEPGLRNVWRYTYLKLRSFISRKDYRLFISEYILCFITVPILEDGFTYDISKYGVSNILFYLLNQTVSKDVKSEHITDLVPLQITTTVHMGGILLTKLRINGMNFETNKEYTVISLDDLIKLKELSPLLKRGYSEVHLYIEG